MGTPEVFGGCAFSVTRPSGPAGSRASVEIIKDLFDDSLREKTDGHKYIPCMDATVISACSEIEAKELLNTSDRLLHISAGH
jgi:hypothetical protein